MWWSSSPVTLCKKQQLKSPSELPGAGQEHLPESFTLVHLSHSLVFREAFYRQFPYGFCLVILTLNMWKPYWTDETSPGVLCPAWEPWNGSDGDGPGSHKNDERAGAPVLQRQPERAGAVQLQKRKVWGELTAALLYLKGATRDLERDCLEGQSAFG